MPRLALFFALTLLFVVPFAFADIPRLISLQGKLTDASDNPVSSSTNFAFRIYDVPTGGTALWTEFQTIAPDTLGIFSALLGSATALNIPFNESYWLEVQVNSEVLSPRTRMGSAGYALRSESPWNATGNDIYTTNAGNVGIGTSGPTTPLHVMGTIKAETTTSDTIIRLNNAGGGRSWGIYSSGTGGIFGANNLGIRDETGGANVLTLTPSGSVGIGTASPDLKLQVDTGNTANGALLLTKAPSKPAFSILPWDSQVYLSAGIYYKNGVWTQYSDDLNNELFTMDPGQGVLWYASNNGAGSWNVASAAQLWNPAGSWTNNVVLGAGKSITIADGTQGDKKVLTSDANGVGSWQTAAGGYPNIRMFIVNGVNPTCPLNSDIIIKKWAPTTCTSTLGGAVCTCTTTASGWQMAPTTCQYIQANWDSSSGYHCGGSLLTCISNQWSSAICIGGN